jgi:hypothetical protein
MATSEQDRRNYVELYRASGLSPVMFCKKHSIKVKTFYKWLKRYPFLSREPGTLPVREEFSGKESFVPLKVTDFEVGQEVRPESERIQSPCEDSTKPPLSLCFKTPHFSLDVCLTMGDHFSDFKLILQAFQDLK